MEKISNKLLLFGAVTAAALVVPGVLGSLVFQEAQAQSGVEQAIDQVGTATGAIAVNANVGANVGVNVEDNEVAACVIVGECDVDQ